MSEKEIVEFLKSRGYVYKGKATDNADLFGKQVKNIILVCRQSTVNPFFYNTVVMGLEIESESEKIYSHVSLDFLVHKGMMYASFDKSEAKLIKMAKAFYEK